MAFTAMYRPRHLSLQTRFAVAPAAAAPPAAAAALAVTLHRGLLLALRRCLPGFRRLQRCLEFSIVLVGGFGVGEFRLRHRRAVMLLWTMAMLGTAKLTLLLEG